MSSIGTPESESSETKLSLVCVANREFGQAVGRTSPWVSPSAMSAMDHPLIALRDPSLNEPYVLVNHPAQPADYLDADGRTWSNSGAWRRFDEVDLRVYDLRR
jgi:hypothetical protein